MKIAIESLRYRAGIGVALEVIGYKGNPPLTVTWQIVTETGYCLETGDVQISLQQWEDWPAGPDNNYIENIVAGMLSVTPLSS